MGPPWSGASARPAPPAGSAHAALAHERVGGSLVADEPGLPARARAADPGVTAGRSVSHPAVGVEKCVDPGLGVTAVKCPDLPCSCAAGPAAAPDLDAAGG